MATEPIWVVILKIEGGSFETGFSCQLLVSPQDRPRETFTGRLPPSLELRDCYDRWKGLYDGLGQANLITLPPQTIVVSHFDECEQAAQQLKRALNAWLNTESFRNMERQWSHTMPSRVRQLHFFVQTDEPCLKRLPWQVWDLLEQHYPDTEVMLSTEYKPSEVVLRSPLRILAVEGNTTGTTARLNLGPLTTHPNLQIETLQQPAKKVFEDSLWDESWDILFFMGHSRSHEFEPNSGEKISVNELHHALENAVKNGLKLAIFNSCDGVDIASKLADLNIPYTIVMRHPIPDKMAELFLETFLKQFAQGKSIHESVHTARRRLKDKNSSFPCADWLPVIYQNPGAPDMRYVKPKARSPWLSRWVAFFLLACLGLALAFWFHNWQVHAEYDRQVSTGEKILWRENDGQPAKNQAVRAFGAGQYAIAIEKFRQSIDEHEGQDPEAVIYLNNARQRLAWQKNEGPQPVRIAVSVPLGSNNPTIAMEMLQGIAQSQSLPNKALSPIEVMIVDDQNSAAMVEKLAPKVADDQTIVAVVGPNASDPSLKAAEIYAQKQLVMLTPTAFSDKMQGLGDYIYRMAPRVETMVQSLKGYLKPTDKAAICFDEKSPDNDVFQNAFRKILAESRIGIAKTPCHLNEGEESEQIVARLKNENVTVLLIAPHISNIDRTFAFSRAALKRKIRLLGSTTLYTSQTINKGSSVDEMIIPVPWVPQVDRSDIFSQQWRANITWRTAMTYDALNVIREGLQKRGHSRQDLRSALQNDRFQPGVTGVKQPIRFEQGHRQISTGFVTVQVQKTTQGFAFVPLK